MPSTRAQPTTADAFAQLVLCLRASSKHRPRPLTLPTGSVTLSARGATHKLFNAFVTTRTWLSVQNNSIATSFASLLVDELRTALDTAQAIDNGWAYVCSSQTVWAVLLAHEFRTRSLHTLSADERRQWLALRYILPDESTCNTLLPPQPQPLTDPEPATLPQRPTMRPCFGAHSLFWLLANRFLHPKRAHDLHAHRELLRSRYVDGFARTVSPWAQQLLALERFPQQLAERAQTLSQFYKAHTLLRYAMATQLHREKALPLLTIYDPAHNYTGLRYVCKPYRYIRARTGTLVRRYRGSVYLAREHPLGDEAHTRLRPFDVLHELHRTTNHFVNLYDHLHEPHDNVTTRLYEQCDALLVGSYEASAHAQTTSVHVRLVFDAVPTSTSHAMCHASDHAIAVSSPFDFDGCVYFPFVLSDLPIAELASPSTRLPLLARRLRTVHYLQLHATSKPHQLLVSLRRDRNSHWITGRTLGSDDGVAFPLSSVRYCIVFDDNRTWDEGDGVITVPLGGNLSRTQLPWRSPAQSVCIRPDAPAPRRALGLLHEWTTPHDPSVRAQTDQQVHDTTLRMLRQAAPVYAQQQQRYHHHNLPPSCLPHPPLRHAWTDTSLGGLQCTAPLRAGTVLGYHATAVHSRVRTPSYAVSDVPVFTSYGGVVLVRVSYEADASSTIDQQQPSHNNLLQHCNEALTAAQQTVHLYTMPMHTSADLLGYVLDLLLTQLHASDQTHTAVTDLTDAERAFLCAHVDAIYTYPAHVLCRLPCIVCDTCDTHEGCVRDCVWTLRPRHHDGTHLPMSYQDPTHPHWTRDRTVLGSERLACDLDVQPRRARFAIEWLLAHLDPYGVTREPHNALTVQKPLAQLVNACPFPSLVRGVVLRDITPMPARARRVIYGDRYNEPDVERAHSELLTLYGGDCALGV